MTTYYQPWHPSSTHSSSRRHRGGDWVEVSPASTSSSMFPPSVSNLSFQSSSEAADPTAPPPSPLCKMYATATVVDKYIYCNGGLEDHFADSLGEDPDRDSSVMHRIDPENGQIESFPLTPELPSRIVQHTSVAVGEKIYIIGNCWCRAPSMFVVDTQKMAAYDITPHSMPPQLHCHTSTLFTISDRSIIFTFGGAVRNRVNNCLFQFDVALGEWRIAPVEGPAAPEPRLYHAACNVRDKYLYVFGGAPDAKTTTRDDVVFNDMWRVDVTAVPMKWERVLSKGDVPTQRGSTSLLFSNPYIFLFGGFDGVSELNDFYRFDVDSALWVRLKMCKNFCGGRWAFASCCFKGKLFYLGGFSQSVHGDADDDDGQQLLLAADDANFLHHHPNSINSDDDADSDASSSDFEFVTAQQEQPPPPRRRQQRFAPLSGEILTFEPEPSDTLRHIVARFIANSGCSLTIGDGDGHDKEATVTTTIPQQ